MQSFAYETLLRIELKDFFLSKTFGQIIGKGLKTRVVFSDDF